ncbi:hypothetical protein [Sphingobacterium spiritivorum]|uniref:hypothetical protein n=1 Tax=Sphingobacterium spiritivorum TaxID=258 RepID=UPI0019195F98|nr:hypothetical protein [Sphingobacterium spiritivorum]QQT24638.1 hypothetical protein I6J02_12860 [Sphingobacterium spiritivorum]
MKNYILLAFTLIFSFKIHAQQQPAAYALNEEYNFWNIDQGATAYVIADQAYIRDYPNTTAKLIDSVTVGTAVKILSPGYNGNKVKGFSAPWHEVSYQKNNETKKGFIWLGLLALGQQVDNEGNQYIFGFDRFVPERNETPAYYSCDVKLLDKTGKLISKYNFHYDYLDQSFFQSKLLPNMGLDGLKNILRLEFAGEACGIPSEYYYVGWNGSEFIDMPKRYTVSDAGIFYYEEKILFPSEHKKEPNMVYKLIEEGQADDPDKEDSKLTITKKQETYIWNGKVFSQLLEMK